MALPGQQATGLCALERVQGATPGVLGRVEPYIEIMRKPGRSGSNRPGKGGPSDKCEKRGRWGKVPEVGGVHSSDEAW